MCHNLTIASTPTSRARSPAVIYNRECLAKEKDITPCPKKALSDVHKVEDVVYFRLFNGCCVYNVGDHEYVGHTVLKQKNESRQNSSSSSSSLIMRIIASLEGSGH
ncbi:hypothetical protein FOMPIDRAFT_1022962 [Fomitopsis schrenkii]|uniref:Uncharacterized protein n=1 Tax=Fomitopsis schrenkii TaxID=2126942 RepID=S8EFW1_FOMSC|nr:hypothetical protein FOMPIDRAFT_1022962 [Fomitopsis schrenkii]